MSDRVSAIEYIRGIAMLGVVGIHTGAYSLSNPHVNIHLFASLEIFTRFSVPIFFFISAFGLFWRYQPDGPFHYRSFLSRRLRTVFIPYLVWSLLYMVHYCWRSGEIWPWGLSETLQYFLFGLASYQLYFLVILLWFYLFMPLWRAVLPLLLRRPVLSLTILLAGQILFNYYSSYLLKPHTAYPVLQLALQYRMSYLVLHYVFVFLLGAVCAVRFNEFCAFAAANRRRLAGFFAIALAGILGCYYWLLAVKGYTPLQAVNTVHQLSPEGVIYTLAACLFLFSLLHQPLPERVVKVLSVFARHSYPIYLVHPFAMYYLIDWLSGANMVLTAPVVLAFYTATVLISLGFGVLLEKATAHYPLIGTLLVGAKPASRRTGSGVGVGA